MALAAQTAISVTQSRDRFSSTTVATLQIKICLLTKNQQPKSDQKEITQRAHHLLETQVAVKVKETAIIEKKVRNVKF